MNLDPGTQAVLESVAWHTVAIVPEEGVELATGVCLRFGDGYWVATVSHAVNGWGVDRLFFIARPSATLATGPKSAIPEHLRKGGHAQERFRPRILECVKSANGEDIALLRLVGPEGGMEFHHLEPGRRSPAVGDRVIVFGFAIETAIAATHGLTGETEGMIFPTIEWSAVVERSERDFTDYDARAHFLMDFSEGPRPEDYVSKPDGMSGAGVWVPPPPVPKDRIWDPRAVTLVGIQTGWYARFRLLKATRIEHVVSLLESVR